MITHEENDTEALAVRKNGHFHWGIDFKPESESTVVEVTS